ncbi:excisionase family DNA-binding protein [Rhodococcus sp. ACPA1]|uniref:excisionase family DNA-binding protein n=1 Tax=Rhodococcus sp. ACPA1 TaxID=2028572 RepID=UPI000BB0DB1E|nr:helix-turn-helix domain-containing protein [Rhodococcus sp. ACPA1]PBC54901.1 hypothetical protein CJ177_17985 [Rhodococcus sp. ACPA1]
MPARDAAVRSPLSRIDAHESWAHTPNRSTRTESREYITVAEAAERAGLSVLTIRRYIASGRLTAHRLGAKLIRVNLDELDELLQPVSPPADAIDAHIAELVAKAPALTAEQRDRIAGILQAGGR